MDRWAADRSRRGGRGDDRRAGERRRRRSALVGKIAVGLVSALVLSTTAYVWAEYRSLVNGVYRSSALDGEAGSLNGDINILIMGLDSRLDENGNPLPPDIYNALHAGGASDGGENANVLMLLHVPANGDRATSISIPRDDYVNLPGCPDGQCKGKIKQAYGLAFDAKSKTLVNQHGLDSVQRVQQERDAARKEEMAKDRAESPEQRQARKARYDSEWMQLTAAEKTDALTKLDAQMKARGMMAPAAK